MNYEPRYKVVDSLDFTVIEKDVRRGKRNAIFDLIRCSSGFTYACARGMHKRRVVRDPYQRTYASVGYLGDLSSVEGLDPDMILRETWRGMMSRCYRRSNTRYNSYGAKGITVSKRWHDLSCFILDAIDLPGWDSKKKHNRGMHLDKDYFGSNVYSKNTCLWMPHWMNCKLNKSRPFLAISPSGEEHYHINPSVFSEKHDLNSRHVGDCLRGKLRHHKGWTFKYTHDRGLGYTVPQTGIGG